MYCNITFSSFLYSHVSFIIVANLLNAHIILGINEGLRSGVGLREGHNTGNILKIILIVNFNLEKQRQQKITPAETPLCWQRDAIAWTCDILTFPIPEWAWPIFTTTGNRGELICKHSTITRLCHFTIQTKATIIWYWHQIRFLTIQQLVTGLRYREKPSPSPPESIHTYIHASSTYSYYIKCCIVLRHVL